MDLNTAGEMVGFDMGHASKLADLSTFETESLPLRNAAAISNPYSNAAPSVPFEYLLAPCRQLIHRGSLVRRQRPHRFANPRH